MGRQPDYYQVLQIETTASQDAIKKAYREKALQYHPDLNADDAAEETFKRINEAYSVLSDAAKRKQYDLYGTVGRIAGAGFSEGFPAGGMCFRPGWGGGCGCGMKGMGHWRAVFRRGPRQVVQEGEHFICTVLLTPAEKETGTQRSVFVNHEGGRKIFTVDIPAGAASGQRILVVEKGRDSPVTVFIRIE